MSETPPEYGTPRSPLESEPALTDNEIRRIEDSAKDRYATIDRDEVLRLVAEVRRLRSQLEGGRSV